MDITPMWNTSLYALVPSQLKCKAFVPKALGHVLVMEGSALRNFKWHDVTYQSHCQKRIVSHIKLRPKHSACQSNPKRQNKKKSNFLVVCLLRGFLLNLIKFILGVALLAPKSNQVEICYEHLHPFRWKSCLGILATTGCSCQNTITSTADSSIHPV